jgi:hypothetical protein
VYAFKNVFLELQKLKDQLFFSSESGQENLGNLNRDLVWRFYRHFIGYMKIFMETQRNTIIFYSKSSKDNEIFLKKLSYLS